MAREKYISFADLRDGRQVQQKMGLSSPEMMRVIRQQMDGASHKEIEKMAHQVFSSEQGKK